MPALDQPIVVRGLWLTVTASCGAVAATDSDDAVAPLQSADLKMYERKRQRHGDDPRKLEHLNARLREAAAMAAQLRASAQDVREHAHQIRNTTGPTLATGEDGSLGQ